MRFPIASCSISLHSIPRGRRLDQIFYICRPRGLLLRLLLQPLDLPLPLLLVLDGGKSLLFSEDRGLLLRFHHLLVHIGRSWLRFAGSLLGCWLLLYGGLRHFMKRWLRGDLVVGLVFHAACHAHCVRHVQVVLLVEGNLGSRLRDQACGWDLLWRAAGALCTRLQGCALSYLLRLDLLLACLTEHALSGLSLLLISLIPLFDHIWHASLGCILRELKLSCVNAIF